MVNYFFLLSPDSPRTIKYHKKGGKSAKCQEDLHFLINMFTIIGELDAKCML